MNGEKVADDYADLYDGEWDQESPARYEDGSSVELDGDSGNAAEIYTGSNQDGTVAIGNDGDTRALGNSTNDWVRVGTLNNSSGGPLSSKTIVRGEWRRFYGLSGVFEDVKRRLSRIWQVIETTDIEMADASERIREHRERKEKLEIAAEEARALLSERRQFLDSADTIAAFAAEMSEFLKSSELTETKAFVRSFVKEIVVKPGRAAIVYSIPTPDDSPAGGADAVEIALNVGVMNSVRHGGLCRTRTCGLLRVR